MRHQNRLLGSLQHQTVTEVETEIILDTTFDMDKFEQIRSIEGTFLAFKLISKGDRLALIQKEPEADSSPKNHYSLRLYSQRTQRGSKSLYVQNELKFFTAGNFTENLIFYASNKNSKFFVVCQEKSSPLSYRMWKFAYDELQEGGNRLEMKELDFRTEARINGKRVKFRLLSRIFEGFLDTRGRLLDFSGESNSLECFLKSPETLFDHLKQV